MLKKLTNLLLPKQIFMTFLSQQLRNKRLEKGFQQKDLAYALKISTAAYSKIENGKTKISLDTAKKIADFLRIPITELVESKSGNIDIKNGNNSPLAIENSTLILQNEKLIETQIKLSEQMIIMMQQQNDLFKEVIKTIKRS
jgi:transcriptional regulator with XRE-family HTH domain